MKIDHSEYFYCGYVTTEQKERVTQSHSTNSLFSDNQSEFSLELHHTSVFIRNNYPLRFMVFSDPAIILATNKLLELLTSTMIYR